MELLTLLSHGLLLTLLAEAEARVISTKISRNNMISELSIRGLSFDIVKPAEINVRKVKKTMAMATLTVVYRNLWNIL